MATVAQKTSTSATKGSIRNKRRSKLHRTKYDEEQAFLGSLPPLTRTFEEVLADPMAAAHELWHTAQKYPKRVAEHPGIPYDLWEKLAPSYGKQACLNPIFELFLLENPFRVNALQEIHMDSWLRKYCNTQTSKAQVQYEVECFLHVMPLLAPVFRRESEALLRQAYALIEMRRVYGVKQLSYQAYTLALSRFRAEGGVLSAAGRKFCEALMFPRGQSVLHSLQESVAFAAAAAGLNEKLYKKQELTWQWKRLVQYFAAPQPSLAKIEPPCDAENKG